VSLSVGGDPPHPPAPAPAPAAVRYRCTLCGNLTRFDVVERRRTRTFHHYTLGGLLTVEEEEILEREIEDVRCRWCNSSTNVEEVPALPAEGSG
jgi:hypothetical protein